MVVATQTATYLDETAGVLATAYGVTVDDALNARLAALYEGDSTVQSEAAWREIRQLLWDRLEPAQWPEQPASFNRRFSDDEVVEIRETYAAGGFTMHDLAVIYECSVSTIQDMVCGVTYADAGGPIQTKRKRFVSAGEAQRIRDLYATGQYTQAQIGAMFGRAQGHVSVILRRSA